MVASFCAASVRSCTERSMYAFSRSWSMAISANISTSFVLGRLVCMAIITPTVHATANAMATMAAMRCHRFILGALRDTERTWQRGSGLLRLHLNCVSKGEMAESVGPGALCLAHKRMPFARSESVNLLDFGGG
jgi:hypothetical protein